MFEFFCSPTKIFDQSLTSYEVQTISSSDSFLSISSSILLLMLLSVLIAALMTMSEELRRLLVAVCSAFNFPWLFGSEESACV